MLIVIFGSMYGLVQQTQRNAADMPQIQLAEDTAAALDSGAKPASLTKDHVDMSASLASFIEIYNRSGQPVSGSGYLDGTLPAIPLGVLQAANGTEYHRVTWQPASHVRIAAVTVSAHNYYVLSGRSLKEIERNENQTFLLALVGGFIAWLVLTASLLLAHPIFGHHQAVKAAPQRRHV